MEKENYQQKIVMQTQVSISKSTKVDDLISKITFKKNKKGNFTL